MKDSLGLFIITCLSLFAQAQMTFDLSDDFSLQNNPNKVWQYGYSASNSLAPDQFRFDKYSDGGSPIGFWHPDASKGPGPDCMCCTMARPCLTPTSMATEETRHSARCRGRALRRRIQVKSK